MSRFYTKPTSHGSLPRTELSWFRNVKGNAAEAILPDLFELALNAHGGLDRWRQVQSLDVRISLTGGLYRLKGYPDGVPNTLMHVETRRIAVDVSPWIGMGIVGHFVPDRVWITDGERRVIDQRSDPLGLVRRPYPRDPLGPVAPALLHKLCNVELPEYAVSFYPTRI